MSSLESVIVHKGGNSGSKSQVHGPTALSVVKHKEEDSPISSWSEGSDEDNVQERNLDSAGDDDEDVMK